MINAAPDEIVEWGMIVATEKRQPEAPRSSGKKGKKKGKRSGSHLPEDVADWWAGDAIVVHHRKRFEAEVRACVLCVVCCVRKLTQS